MSRCPAARPLLALSSGREHRTNAPTGRRNRFRNSFALLATASAAACGITAGCGSRTVTKKTAQEATGFRGGANALLSSLLPAGEGAEKVIASPARFVKVLDDGANLPENLRGLVDAVAITSNGCTATHVGNGIVISAGHCFQAPARRAANPSCADVFMYWGMRADKRAYLKSTCSEVLAYQESADVDYAIFRVTPVPPVAARVDLAARPLAGTPVTMLSYPQGRPLEWSQYCKVAPGAVAGYGRGLFAHQCDTEPGSSGAALVDTATSRIVGIHKGGTSPVWNSATYLTDTPLAEYARLLAPSPRADQAAGARFPAQNDSQTANPASQAALSPQSDNALTGLDLRPGYNDLLYFSPLGNNENRVLKVLPQAKGRFASFDIHLDTEEGHDGVLIIDGTGKVRARFSGRLSRHGRNLPTPVVIIYRSDAQNPSRSVGISNVSYSN